MSFLQKIQVKYTQIVANDFNMALDEASEYINYLVEVLSERATYRDPHSHQLRKLKASDKIEMSKRLDDCLQDLFQFSKSLKMSFPRNPYVIEAVDELLKDALKKNIERPMKVKTFIDQVLKKWSYLLQE